MLRQLLFILSFILITQMGIARGAEYSLAIQPLLSPESIEAAYQPLADYLSAETGDTIKISSYTSFKDYWSSMKRLKGFDLVLDAAHFTDYRIKKMGYRVLAKLPDTVTLSIVTAGDLYLLDKEELLPYKIATMKSPSIGGLRLRQIFPDPARRPNMKSATDSEDALSQLKNGTVDAAIVPTLYLVNHPDLNVVLTTEPMPHMGLSVSPEVPALLAEKIKQALLNATKTVEGREMLSSMRLTSFVPATEQVYDGYSSLLEYMGK